MKNMILFAILACLVMIVPGQVFARGGSGGSDTGGMNGLQMHNGARTGMSELASGDAVRTREMTRIRERLMIQDPEADHEAAMDQTRDRDRVHVPVEDAEVQ